MDKFLVIAIVNKGFSDLVMEAARKEGARGGTVLGARGTGNQELEKFYGIVIHPDKEFVLIVVNGDIKEKVMKKIYEDCGLESKSQGIVFSLPIDDVKGISEAVKNVETNMDEEVPSSSEATSN